MMRLLCYIILLSATVHAQAKLKVITTTTDLAAVVRELAGDKVDVTAIAKGTQDIHQIEAKPSYMVLMRNADLVFSHGLELESAWLTPLIVGSRNPKIAVSGQGYMELAGLLDPIEVRSGSVSRAEGDVHPGGNPHFQLDPVRLAKAAELMAVRLAELDSANGDFYKNNAAAWSAKMRDKTKTWMVRIKNSKVKEVVTYHKTFSYFCARFEVVCDLQLEPRPGIPPTVSHLLEVTKVIRERKIPVVFVENYFDLDSAAKLKSEVPGLKVVELPVSVLGESQILTNEQVIERLVSAIERAGK